MKTTFITHVSTLSIALLALLALGSASAQARHGEAPYSFTHAKSITATPPLIELDAIDPARLLREDAAAVSAAAAQGEQADKRLRVGISQAVDISPADAGAVQRLGDGGTLWRVSVRAAHATDLRFGFGAMHLPAGATLHVLNAADGDYQGPFTAANARSDGRLWTVPVAGDTLTLEVHVPAGMTLAGDALRVTTVSAGYRNATEHGGPGLFGAGESGACNVDVVCPLGDGYRDEIRAVAKYYFDEPDGTYLCTGTLINNTAADDRPLFLTANHCVSTAAAAASMSLIWNYQSPTCGQHGGGSTADTQEDGAALTAHRADVDFSLVTLNSAPPASYNVYYAGWDASGTAPGGTIGVHHPSGWVKAITENTHTPTTINSCIGSGGSNTHWKTGPYAQGTTEGGSSGSAIFNPAGGANGQLVIGTLSGGGAACSGNVPNTQTDCYGKLSVAFNGSAASSRLKDALDPDNTGVTSLGGKNPGSGSGTDDVFKDGFDGGNAANP